MDSVVLLAYVSLAVSRTNDYQSVWTLLYIQKIYSVSTNEKGDFYELWQQQKHLKTIKMSEVCMTLTMRDICINSNLNRLTKSLAAAEARSLNISSHGTSLKWSRRPPQSAQESSYAMWWNGASCCEFDGKSIENRDSNIRISQWRENHCITSTSIRRNK